MKGHWIGIDLGSVSVKIALVTDDYIERTCYRRHFGRPVETLAAILSEIDGWQNRRFAITGSASYRFNSGSDIKPVNEVVALAAAITEFYPNLRSVIELGGQDSKLLLFRKTSKTSFFDDFSMNSVCAAGTGSFLDQQATRLGLEVEEFGSLALESENPPRIAGRCSVFAKSDMIHLQQVGARIEDIVAGLCFAVARNFKSTIASGKDFRPPVAFVGGVAANAGMVRAFQEILAEECGEIIIPEHHACLCAIGVTLCAGAAEQGILPEDLLAHTDLRMEVDNNRKHRPVLNKFRGNAPENSILSKESRVSEPVFLGVDVGSISTNVVALNSSGNVLAREYLMTSGQPLEAVKRGLRLISETLGPDRKVLGVGTTGSGRYMIGDFIGADVIRNEITAQARAAVEVDPDVDTIFEIGGQDSKYISLKDGRVVDFEMNKVCAAGTGSFLEEQAEKLSIDICDFGEIALDAEFPATLGERCTVFMESDVVSHQAKGTSTDGIVSGLCYSIVSNYLHRVVGDRKIGKKIFFQGGTAFNQGVVAAFNSVLGKKITVPPNHEVTGAIGVAILARDEMQRGPSSFKGFNLSERSYSLGSFICRECSNQCDIHSIILEDGKKLFYGSRCEKYDVDRNQSVNQGTNFFPLKEKLLFEKYVIPETNSGRKKIGVPRALWFWELFPFFNRFFSYLGFDVIVSSRSNPELVHDGVESVAAETCFPVKLAHGHVLDLIRKNIDMIFLPSILRPSEQTDFNESFNCPYIQGSPYIIEAALNIVRKNRIKLLSPVLDFSLKGRKWKKPLIEMAKELGIAGNVASRACDEAKSAFLKFEKSLMKEGKIVLQSLDDKKPTFVIVSRPYNTGDPFVNVDLPRKLSKLGVNVIPLEFLQLPIQRTAEKYRNMYWHYGQKILAAAVAIKENPHLNAVYLTNFGCGPDSFIHHYFADLMGNKPYLTLEIDEHAADAGVITRCEAFLDSLKGRAGEGSGIADTEIRIPEKTVENRTVWIPYMSDGSHLVSASARRHGVDARVMAQTSDESVTLGRSVTSGRECYPAIITSGNMLRILERENPEKTAFFMGTASGPCRFGQYCNLHRIILDNHGFEKVPIVTASSSDSYTSIPSLSSLSFQLDFLKGALISDILMRSLLRIRPYEVKPGETDFVHKTVLDNCIRAMEEGKSLTHVIKNAAKQFNRIQTVDTVKPLLLYFGEIYVRNDPYANSETIRRIEKLGGEVLYTPIMEWFEFVNYSYLHRVHKNGKPLSMIKALLKGFVISALKHSFERHFVKIFHDRPELSSGEILKAASPYMKENVGGEAILCIGAPVALSKRKAIDGAVNVLPFTCLPGTIVTAVSKGIRKDYPDLPWLNLAFDGQEDTDTDARLEAFMYQVRQIMTGRSDMQKRYVKQVSSITDSAEKQASVRPGQSLKGKK